MKATEPLSPQAVMMQIMGGKFVSRCVSLVAELGIADLLRDGPRDAVFLARSTGTSPDVLYRVLRLLAGVDVFVELPGKQFQQSRLSEVLCSDSPGSMRQFARWCGTAFHSRVVADLEYSVRTGQPASTKGKPGRSPFEVLAEDATAQEIFNETMSGFSMADGPAIVESYEFSSYARVTDVGGGHGTLAAMILRSAPNANVTVFDQPHVIQGVAKRLLADFPAAKITTAAGSFLHEVPGPTDLCILKHILHDWEDAVAVRILANCRKALADGGRILVCEMIITPSPESTPAKILDIEMLLCPGGRERTESEFSELFRKAGLRLGRVVPTRTSIRLLEATIA